MNWSSGWDWIRGRQLEPGRAECSEKLHSIERQGAHLPLVVLVAMDRDGHLVDVRECDADDYDR